MHTDTASFTAPSISAESDTANLVPPLLAALLAASGPAQAEPLVALPWLAAVFVGHGMQTVLARQLAAPGVMRLLHVLCWAVPPVAFWSPDNSAQNILIALALLGRLAVSDPVRARLRELLCADHGREALVEELRRRESAAETACRQAETENRTKSQFLATMSHELRTPLNAILGFSDVLRREMLGPLNVKKYKDYADDIHTSGEHLLALVNDVLDLSRIEAGRYELHEEPVSLPRTARECCAIVALRARQGEVEIVESFEESFPLVRADARAIRQIWLNLISNAVKFTPAGGQVTVSVRRDRDGAPLIAVRDEGPGIARDEIATVLKPFGQAPSATPDHRNQGVGLGLPIVDGLALLHGGKLAIASAPGRGTEVTVHLPSGRILPGTVAPVEPPEEPLDGRRRLVALTA